MHINLWRPSARAALLLAVLALIGCGLGAYMRYWLVEPSSVGLVCDGGAQGALCAVRRMFIGIFVKSGFGLAAIAATLLALIRPSALLVGAALLFGGLGVVLYNTGLSALALALLPLTLARRAPPREFRPE